MRYEFESRLVHQFDMKPRLGGVFLFLILTPKQ